VWILVEKYSRFLCLGRCIFTVLVILLGIDTGVILERIGIVLEVF